MATPPKRMQVFAPLKGSFPIDHFKECDEYYKNYMDCIKSNSGASTKCRNETKEYMEWVFWVKETLIFNLYRKFSNELSEILW